MQVPKPTVKPSPLQAPVRTTVSPSCSTALAPEGHGEACCIKAVKRHNEFRCSIKGFTPRLLVKLFETWLVRQSGVA